MKICHLVDTLNIGGLEKTVLEIALNLKGYEHQIWCLKEKGAMAQELEDNGVKVVVFNVSGGLGLFPLLRLKRALRAELIDVVHSHGIFPAVWGSLAAMLAGVPKRFIHCQNLYHDVAKKEVIKFRLLSGITTRFIAVSDAVKKCLTGFFGISEGKITLVYNCAADLKASLLEKEEARRTLKMRKDDIVVGVISRLEKHKGHHILLEALAQCRAKGLMVKCVIAGDGPERERLQELSQSKKLNDAVLFLGWRKDIKMVLAAMDIFVQPSCLTEGLPLALAEAASAGLPLIATFIGGNPEIVSDGTNGFIVPANDAVLLAQKIEFLVQNPGERALMGENSRIIWKEKFSLEKMINAIDALYKG